MFYTVQTTSHNCKVITINVPLILKMQAAIFFAGKLLGSGHFRSQKSLGPLKMSLKMSHKVICPKTKENTGISNFLNFQYINSFYVSPSHIWQYFRQSGTGKPMV